MRQVRLSSGRRHDVDIVVVGGDVCRQQGDRMVPVVYFGQSFFKKAKFWATFFKWKSDALAFAKIWVGRNFGRLFSQAHPVTMVDNENKRGLERRKLSFQKFRHLLR
jgi:hypothetical protein